MKIVIVSDVHGNITALKKTIESFHEEVDALIMLGDLIDYGPHSNEVVSTLNSISYRIICNIWGNHEAAISNGSFERFSSERGRVSAKYTRSKLSGDSWNYILNSMSKSGMAEFTIDDKRCLAVHGSLEDTFWKAISPGQNLDGYKGYDYVFSGHSHIPHVFAEFYSCENPQKRNKKKTTFVNPGSVGQPRNHNVNAQYAIWDTETDEISLKCVPYEIKKEQAFFSKDVDAFYRDRLELGI